MWDTYRTLVPSSAVPKEALETCDRSARLDSFMHLHLGIDATGLPPPHELGIHHLVVNSWEGGVAANQNVVNISIPTCLDPALAPPNKHVVHAYTAANEPYAPWANLDRRSAEYKAFKEERAECLWKALERFIPDVRDRVDLSLVGSPLTHERYVRRSAGTYGPGIVAGEQSWPTAKTPIEGLLMCGDSTFPGIGVPAVAGSGFIAANTIASLPQHWSLLEELNA